jgi:hypothetical protein
MTFAGAIFLIVVGAILRWGVHLHIEHVNEQFIGLILIIAGLVGLVVALFQTLVWSRRGVGGGPYYGDRYYDSRY